jgi:hypothetical protein
MSLPWSALQLLSMADPSKAEIIKKHSIEGELDLCRESFKSKSRLPHGQAMGERGSKALFTNERDMRETMEDPDVKADWTR